MFQHKRLLVLGVATRILSLFAFYVNYPPKNPRKPAPRLAFRRSTFCGGYD
jgi:hypothetical protein